MFEQVEDDAGNKVWTSVHHPFTSPNEEWLARFEESPGEALAWAYDLVCNGNEIGGGSIRIHDAKLQAQVFTLIGLDPDVAAERFGHILEAFRYGTPPHGGIAPGIDRICMLLAGEPNIREVIDSEMRDVEEVSPNLESQILNSPSETLR